MPFCLYPLDLPFGNMDRNGAYRIQTIRNQANVLRFVQQPFSFLLFLFHIRNFQIGFQNGFRKSYIFRPSSLVYPLLWNQRK